MGKKKKVDYSRYQKYAKDVISGKIVAGKPLILACKRFLSWFDRTDIYFDCKECDKVLKFISCFKHYSGSFSGKPFILLPFQEFIIFNIFGWKYKETGKRVTRKAFISVARKNGKTLLVSVLQLYMMFMEGDGDAQCVSIANSTAQASLCFNMACTLLKQIDPKGKHFRFYRDMIKYPKTNSFIKVLSSDTSRLDGYNIKVGVVDEFHASQTNETYSILKTSQGARDNGLILVITTSGYLLEGVCHQMYDACLDILNGNSHDDSQAAIIFAQDEDDDIFNDESCWEKSNPSINHIIRPEYLREQLLEAKNNSSLMTSVLTKNFNKWCSTQNQWLPTDVIQNCQGEIPDEFWIDKTVWCGLDLSSVEDMTALSIMTYVPDEDKYYFKTINYLPQETINNSPNSELYKNWARKNYLKVTEGNVVDYDYILSDLMKIYQHVDCVAQVGYDKFNSTYLVTKATEQGIPMIPISQSMGSMNRPTKELTRLMMSGKVVYEHNPITRWCFHNCALKTDWNENVRPVKGGSISGKIDTVVSMIMALSAYQGGNSAQSEIFSLQY